MSDTINSSDDRCDIKSHCDCNRVKAPEPLVMAPLVDQACCGSSSPFPSDPNERPGYVLWHFVEGFLNTPAGEVPQVKTDMSPADLVGTFSARAGINRGKYRVAPGLYCTGTPDNDSPVLLSANYKLSFDVLRKGLNKISAWILVLDTRGINVWCAAGKGTFSADEIIKRVKLCELEKIVIHRELILPQLSATGVSAVDVKKGCGFKVVWGPVRAAELKRFLTNQNRADQTMRRVTFTMGDRLILVPVEISLTIRPLLWSLPITFVLSGVGSDIFSFGSAWSRGLSAILALIAGLIAGTVVVPALLPWIPGKAFSFKGAIVGLLVGIGFVMVSYKDFSGFEVPSLILTIATVSSYLAMNFTGATPFTSPSGVEKEMRWAIPFQVLSVLLASTLWVWSRFV